jgi:flavin reductase (DIM6/NTAB) family NADH-FMN oxidoreductase RutF
MTAGADSMPINVNFVRDPDAVRRAARFMATGVTVITTVDAEGKPVGATANAVITLSLAPPSFLISFGHNSNTLACVRSHGRLAVNVLSAEQSWIARRFATKARDKFQGLEVVQEATDIPILLGSVVVFECHVHQIIDVFDHSLVVGIVDNVVFGSGLFRGPLIYYRGEYFSLPVEQAEADVTLFAVWGDW